MTVALVSAIAAHVCSAADAADGCRDCLRDRDRSPGPAHRPPGSIRIRAGRAQYDHVLTRRRGGHPAACNAKQRDRRSRITSSWFRRAGPATRPRCCRRSVPRRASTAKSLAACIASRSWPPPWRRRSWPAICRSSERCWTKAGSSSAVWRQGVSSTEIDRWYQIAQERGAYGGKIAGAGGGGFFLFCVPPDRRADVISGLCARRSRAVAVRLRRPGMHRRDDPVAGVGRSRTRIHR